MSLEDVIARLEAAEERDQGQALWAAIILACDSGWIPERAIGFVMKCIGVGAFLDAALALLPAGARLHRLGEDGHGKWAAALLWPAASGEAKTGPLALCVACLRARAAS